VNRAPTAPFKPFRTDPLNLNPAVAFRSSRGSALCHNWQ
jgi:hypothetical protein